MIERFAIIRFFKMIPDGCTGQPMHDAYGIAIAPVYKLGAVSRPVSDTNAIHVCTVCPLNSGTLKLPVAELRTALPVENTQ
jgi:hypothetical protein